MPLPAKRFQVVNEGFTCANCGREVPPTAQTTPRNHCPFCLWSRHVDVNPGDRANRCRGLLRPIGIETHARKQYIIRHQCLRCGARVRSKAILEDANAADDFDRIIELAGKVVDEKRPLPPYQRGALRTKKGRKA